MTVHPIPPVFDENSRILLLGSFPSVKSRETAFFYGHKQNRFWKVISAVFDSSEPQTIPEKKAFLIKNGIAVWDVIASCDIDGSADNTIKNVTPNDLSQADWREFFAFSIKFFSVIHARSIFIFRFFICAKKLKTGLKNLQQALEAV